MLLHADNFSIYGSQSALMLNGVYAESNCQLVVDPDGVSGGRVFVQTPAGAPDNNTVPFRYVLQFGAVTTLGIAARYWLTALPNSDGALFDVNIRSQANAFLARIFFTANGRIAITIDGGPETFTTVPVITANAWYHIEWKFTKLTTVTCEYEIRVEGVTVLQATGVACSNLDIGIMRTSSGNISRNYATHMKDFILWDGSGTYNNNFLGTQLVTNLAPSADVLLGWTPNVGTEAWPILNNVPPDPAEFIFADVAQVNTPYRSEMTNLPLNTTSIKGVITYVRAAKTDGGDGELQVALISNGDTGLGSNRPITIAQTYWRDIFETDPDTALPWSPAAVNLATMQINRTL